MTRSKERLQNLNKNDIQDMIYGESQGFKAGDAYNDSPRAYSLPLAATRLKALLWYLIGATNSHLSVRVSNLKKNAAYQQLAIMM